MRRFRLVMMAMLVAALTAPLLVPGVAQAALSGTCQARAEITGSGGDSGTYEAIDPKAKTGVYTVPISGSAAYIASVAGDPSAEVDERPISGSVSVALPFGGSVSLKSWPDPDATKMGDVGTVTWDLPGATPRGIEMTVSGSHADPAGSCNGSITVKLDGGLMDSVTGVASLVLTALAGIGAAIAAIPKKLF